MAGVAVVDVVAATVGGKRKRRGGGLICCHCMPCPSPNTHKPTNPHPHKRTRPLHTWQVAKVLVEGPIYDADAAPAPPPPNNIDDLLIQPRVAVRERAPAARK